MGLTDLFADLYSTLSFTEVHAEAPEVEEKEEEGDESKSEEGKEEGGDEEEEEEEEEPEDPKPKLEEGGYQKFRCVLFFSPIF
ncbi:hypothetical protein MMC18_006107 [Xylographa bjoerkii]|nr:hypothetical protein [Xylographa bjoerkii]